MSQPPPGLRRFVHKRCERRRLRTLVDAQGSRHVHEPSLHSLAGQPDSGTRAKFKHGFLQFGAMLTMPNAALFCTSPVGWRGAFYLQVRRFYIRLVSKFLVRLSLEIFCRTEQNNVQSSYTSSLCRMGTARDRIMHHRAR